MTSMHITTTEAALAAVLLTAATGWLANRSAQRATQTRDHLTRLWEQRAAIYEAVLAFVFPISTRRSDMMERIDKIVKTSPDRLLPSSEQDALNARVFMYANREVRDAYLTWKNAELAWIDAYDAIFAEAPDETNLDSRAKARMRAKSANDAAKVATSELMQAVLRAVKSGPKLGWP